MMATTATPVIRAQGEGDRRWFYGGGTHTWKVTAEESGGAFLLFEDVMAGGKMTPWHCHPDTDELVYVLEGEILVNVDGQERTVGAGGVSMSPRGVPHAFTVTSESARLLLFQTPGSAEAFYWGASEPATNDGPGPVDFDRIRAIATETGATNVMGPPPFAKA
jgi:quercetin dioxygenase-like cupin family protein